ncbi:MAG TPA: LytTR family transcriptional regulator DNA-binding domain-containing protein [Cytophagaceae bacterium]|jgi:two-component system LytT family response regulator|nr:LytTR family transcriptional regulator DNA-binding domain-containing protein [Cytophagaceae bacterium]
MSTVIRTLIIDDEPLARELIRTFLKDYPAFQVVAECINGFDGLKAIQELKPDVIFLDVEMPKVSGLEMLELVDEMPLVIFTTAYEEHAIKAFEMNALDYLLKPFTKERFKKSIDKIEDRQRHKSDETVKLRHLSENHSLRQEALERVVVKTVSSIKVIPLSDILYLEAQDDYVMIHTSEGSFLKQQTMKYFEQALPAKQFIRIHRSYIINIREMLRIEPYEKNGYQIVLKSSGTLPVSRNGYSLLKEKLNF